MKTEDRKKMRALKALSFIRRGILPKSDILYLLQVDEVDLQQYQSEFDKLVEGVFL